MTGGPFIRNTRASDSLEIFFLSSITSLLTLRLYLHLTGYPQVGGEHLHIAHMLYGGILMLVANILLLSFVGRRITRIAAIVGGIGFGLFIDELGKFITKDNNYFYQPTVALIYIIFVVLSLIIRVLSRERGFDKREYLVNGLLQLEEAALHDMDNLEREHVLALLHRADQNDPLTKELIKLVTHLQPQETAQRSRGRRMLYRLRNWYDDIITTRWARISIVVFFIVDSTIIIARLWGRVIIEGPTELQDHLSYSTLAQLVSSIISAILVVIGIYFLTRSRLVAYEFFRRALLVTLFVTEFFAFYREEFGALGGFFINLAAFIVIRYLLSEEHRLVRQQALRR